MKTDIVKNLKIIIPSILAIGLILYYLYNYVPGQVKTAFVNKFPSAINIEWTREKVIEWEVEFELNTIEYSASFDSEGNWIQTEQEIKVDEVPLHVMSTVHAKYPEYTIEEAEVLDKPEGIYYEFEIKNNDQELELIINPDGELIHFNN